MAWKAAATHADLRMVLQEDKVAFIITKRQWINEWKNECLIHRATDRVSPEAMNFYILAQIWYGELMLQFEWLTTALCVNPANMIPEVASWLEDGFPLLSELRAPWHGMIQCLRKREKTALRQVGCGCFYGTRLFAHCKEKVDNYLRPFSRINLIASTMPMRCYPCESSQLITAYARKPTHYRQRPLRAHV